MSDGSIVKTRKAYEKRSLDDLIYEYATEKTLAKALDARVMSRNARTYFITNLLCSAIFDLDVGLIAEIIKRLDGGAPAAGEVDMYSSTFANALDEVLSATDANSIRVYPTDTIVMALAKALFCIANKDPGKNFQDRKDRQRAVQMILDRMEGRKEGPGRIIKEIEYDVPDWMGLPEGETS